MKKVKFLRVPHPSKLPRSLGEKDKSNWKSKENYSQPVTTTHQKFETKKPKKNKKRKERTLNSDTILVFL